MYRFHAPGADAEKYYVVTPSNKEQLTFLELKSQYPSAIWTTTPGPDVPESIGMDKWLENPSLVGCSRQLGALDRLNQPIIVISSGNHDRLQLKLREKGWNNIIALSDPNCTLATKLGLTTISYLDHTFYGRQSSINGFETKIPVPVDDNGSVDEDCSIINANVLSEESRNASCATHGLS